MEGCRRKVDSEEPRIEVRVAERAISLQIAPPANAFDAVSVHTRRNNRRSAIVNVSQAYRTRFVEN